MLIMPSGMGNKPPPRFLQYRQEAGIGTNAWQAKLGRRLAKGNLPKGLGFWQGQFNGGHVGKVAAAATLF